MFMQWQALSINDALALLLYLVMHVIIDVYRIRLQKTTVTLAMAIMLAVLFEYGILIVTAISLLSLIIGAMISGIQSLRVVTINASMIFLSTLSAGLIFEAIGGVSGTAGVTKWVVVAGFVFSLVVLIVNHAILIALQEGRFRKPPSWMMMEIFWDFGANLVSLPIAVLLYEAHLRYSWFGLVLFVLPMIAISAMFQLYNQTYQENRRLQRLYQVLAQMATEVRMERFIRLLRKVLMEVFEVRRFQLIEWQSESHRLVDLETERIVEQPRWEALMSDAVYPKIFIQTWQDQQLAYVIPLRSQPSGNVITLKNDHSMGLLVLMLDEKQELSKDDEEMLFQVTQQLMNSMKFIRKMESRERRSKIDELTGLANLRAFQELLNEQIETCESSASDLSLILLDIDHFKNVNDVHGHLVGNQVLKQIAQILTDTVELGDSVCRYGGEEFAVILPKQSPKQAEFVAEQIRQRVEQHRFMIYDSIQENAADSLGITVSIGVATFPQFARSSVDLIRLADRAMYIGAKRAGRNRVSVFGVHQSG